jgi:DNA-binding phage protein
VAFCWGKSHAEAGWLVSAERETLYQTLSAEGNPERTSISAILRAMGMRLAMERVKAA